MQSSKWIVSKNPTLSRSCYKVFRLRDICQPIDSRNIEFFPDFTASSRAYAVKVANGLNIIAEAEGRNAQ